MLPQKVKVIRHGQVRELPTATSKENATWTVPLPIDFSFVIRATSRDLSPDAFYSRQFSIRPLAPLVAGKHLRNEKKNEMGATATRKCIRNAESQAIIIRFQRTQRETREEIATRRQAVRNGSFICSASIALHCLRFYSLQLAFPQSGGIEETRLFPRSSLIHF